MVREIAICELNGCEGKLELITEIKFLSNKYPTKFYECKSCGTIFEKEEAYSYMPSDLTKAEVFDSNEGRVSVPIDRAGEDLGQINFNLEGIAKRK